MLYKHKLVSAICILVLLILQSSCENDGNRSSQNKLPDDQQNQSIDNASSELEPSPHSSEGSIEKGIGAELPDIDLSQPSEASPVANGSDNELLQEIDKDELIENLGFSEATESFQTNNDESSELFCLNPDIENDVDSVTQLCKKMSDRLASVHFKQCVDLQLAITGCNSVKGTPIVIREFPPLPNREPLGRILVIGGTHGDELTSVSVTVRWIEQLIRNHKGLYHWHMTPLMNPDGVLKPGATRTNHNGVDLNRNMPSEDWNEKALQYWRDKSAEDKRKFPGDLPASEPETQWLIDEIKHFKPDAIISVHAPYGVVDFDSLLLNTAPKSLGKLHLNLLGTYPGSLGNYAGINRNIPVITLELPHSWEMPSKQDSNRIWDDIVKWLKMNIKPDDS